MGRSMATENGGNEPDTKDGKLDPSEPVKSPGRNPCSDGEGEEGRRSKGLSAPMKVSKEEREEHERTHTHTIQSMVSGLCAGEGQSHAAHEGQGG